MANLIYRRGLKERLANSESLHMTTVQGSSKEGNWYFVLDHGESLIQAALAASRRHSGPTEATAAIAQAVQVIKEIDCT